MDELWFVRPYDFLADMSAAAKEDLFSIGTVLNVNKDELIFNAGAPSDSVYVLLNGRIKIYELTREGKEVILWFCFPGELFGIAEIMTATRRVVHAHACTSVKVLKVQRDLFTKYLLSYPQVSFRVIELLACRLRELGDIMTNLVADNVSSRVIKLLTRLCARYGRDNGREYKLDICLTHQELADMIGTTRQTVTSVLSSLKRQGFLRIENKTIYIQNHQWVNNIVLGSKSEDPKISSIN